MTIKKTWKDAPSPRNNALPNAAALISRLANEKYTFKTVNFKSGKTERTYFKDKTVIAVETVGKNGALLQRTGKLPDGFYSEYYDDGTLKAEKTLIKSSEYGPLKTYFPGGMLQNEAYYVAGKLDGLVKIYNENGKPLFEQDFKNGIPDGYLKEYDADGRVKSETFYKAGHITAAPAESAAAKNIRVKSIKLARASEFSFYEERRYLCKIQLNNGLNILSQAGVCPGGISRAYSKEGKLEKEFVFVDNGLSALKIFNEEGNIIAEKNYAGGN
jgi:antitoxin component YwqK of YwqJK toxin-antitoxin module